MLYSLTIYWKLATVLHYSDECDMLVLIMGETIDGDITLIICVCTGPYVLRCSGGFAVDRLSRRRLLAPILSVKRRRRSPGNLQI